MYVQASLVIPHHRIVLFRAVALLKFFFDCWIHDVGCMCAQTELRNLRAYFQLSAAIVYVDSFPGMCRCPYCGVCL